MIRSYRFCLGLLPLLAACAQQPAAPLIQASLRPAAEIVRFHLEGRLQVKEGERIAAVGLEWQHDAERDDWLFTGPLGQGLARIEAGPDGARLTAADGRISAAASPAELGEALLGISAPFEALPPWATARLRPGAQVRELDGLGRPRRVVDAGWTLDYLEYSGAGADDLPHRIDVERGDTRLRLIIDAWNP